jgi:hypothetical protein
MQNNYDERGLAAAVVEVEAGEDEGEVEEEQDEEEEDWDTDDENDYLYDYGFTDTDGDTDDEAAEDDEDEDERAVTLELALFVLEFFPDFIYSTVRPSSRNLLLPPSYPLEARLRRFVDALESRRHVEVLTLGRIDQFAFEEDDADGAREDEDDAEEQDDRIDEAARHIQRALEVDRLLERLFGSVVPRHPTLHTVNFDGCLPQSIERFAAAFPAVSGPLRDISFSNVSLEPSCAQAVAAMKVQALSLSNIGLGADGWKIVCDAIGMNPHLRSVSIDQRDLVPRPDTFAGLTRGGSAVAGLDINVAWKPEAFDSFVRCLRTNEVLRFLWFFPLRARRQDPFKPMLLAPLEDLLWSHNCALYQVFVVPNFRRPSCCHRVLSLVKRNYRVRKAGEKLAMREHPYRIDQKLWAHAIGRVSSHPSLIQRILRRGNVGQFAGHMGRLVQDGQLPLDSPNLRPQKKLNRALRVRVRGPERLRDRRPAPGPVRAQPGRRGGRVPEHQRGAERVRREARARQAPRGAPRVPDAAGTFQMHRGNPGRDTFSPSDLISLICCREQRR